MFMHLVKLIAGRYIYAYDMLRSCRTMAAHHKGNIP
jgi:hypothetical protein